MTDLPWQAPFRRLVANACAAADGYRRNAPPGAAVWLYYRPADTASGAWGALAVVLDDKPPAGWMPVRPERIPSDIPYGHLEARWRDTFRRLPVIGADDAIPPELRREGPPDMGDCMVALGPHVVRVQSVIDWQDDTRECMRIARRERRQRASQAERHHVTG